MKIENKIIPEGINTADESPLKEFSLLVFGIIGTLIAVIVILSFVVELLVPFVPFRWEKEIADRYQEALLHADPGGNASQDHRQLAAYLQQLADRVAKAQSLPADMSVTVHYVDADTVNAFATLGGHVVFFRGLLEKMPDENALAWVMAHEISHVKNRAPVVSLGRGVIVGIVISVAGAAIGDDMVGNVMGQSGLLTMLKFSRVQEEEADVEALHSLHDLYGHAGSASAFFQQAKKMQEDSSIGAIELFQTHPLTDNRISKIEEIIRNEGWRAKGETTPLPKDFAQWLQQDKKEAP